VGDARLRRITVSIARNLGARLIPSGVCQGRCRGVGATDGSRGRLQKKLPGRGAAAQERGGSARWRGQNLKDEQERESWQDERCQGGAGRGCGIGVVDEGADGAVRVVGEVVVVVEAAEDSNQKQQRGQAKREAFAPDPGAGMGWLGGMSRVHE